MEKLAVSDGAGYFSRTNRVEQTEESEPFVELLGEVGKSLSSKMIRTTQSFIQDIDSDVTGTRAEHVELRRGRD